MIKKSSHQISNWQVVRKQKEGEITEIKNKHNKLISEMVEQNMRKSSNIKEAVSIQEELPFFRLIIEMRKMFLLVLN